ncbi:MAG: trypsin-like peptidase domain-containing protein [Rhodospirillales bacterium]
MNDQPQVTATDTGVAVLEHLTGPSRGRRTWIAADAVDIALTPSSMVHCRETRNGLAPDGLVARFRRRDGSYELIAAADQTVWVNGEPVRERVLRSGDMIELGDRGPLSRFRLFREEGAMGHTIGEIFSDAAAYLRSSRQPLARRLWRAAGAVARRTAGETTVLFRLGVIAALVVLAGVIYEQQQRAGRLEQRIASGAARLDSVATALARAQQDALTPGDLQALGSEIDERVRANAERLAALEERSSALARVIADAAPSTGFLQTAFGFRDTESGLMLRYQLDEAGDPVTNQRGQPALTLAGDGDVAEVQVTGTGFALAGQRALLTNRHVAMPWENDSNVELMALQGLVPVHLRTSVYFPGRADAAALTQKAVSDKTDLAILVPTEDDWPVAGLSLAETPPEIGSEIVVMGFPTGFVAMLARTDPALVAELQDQPDMDFWTIAAFLAARGQISPLASRGIVGQVSPTAIIYDADTTHGGSGGPVLDTSGRVVAVNAAIIRDFGGSNIGVPVAEARRLLAAAGLGG